MDMHIIVLAYNCLDKIKQCINSIYKNTDNFKLFILDNGSTDGVEDYIKSIKIKKDNLFFKRKETNLGIIKGRNVAYKFSQSLGKSDLIIFLDADQFVQKNWIDSYLEMMKDFDIVGIEAWKMRNDFYPIRKNKNKSEDYSYVGAGGMMTKTEIFEDLGLFDEEYDFMYFEDPNFCFSANKKGYKVGWNYNPVIIHNHSGPLLSKKGRLYFLKNWKVFQSKWKKEDIPLLNSDSI